MPASVSLPRMPFWHMQKAWDLVMCSHVKMSQAFHAPSTFYTSTERLTCLKLLKCAFTKDSDIWAGCLTITFAGSFHFFKRVFWLDPVLWKCCLCSPTLWSTSITCGKLGKHVYSITPEMCLYFDSEVWGGCLTIIFVGSFPYFKFLIKINSRVRRK